LSHFPALADAAPEARQHHFKPPVSPMQPLNSTVLMSSMPKLAKKSHDWMKQYDYFAADVM
jgi:hypothetical protein